MSDLVEPDGIVMEVHERSDRAASWHSYAILPKYGGRCLHAYALNKIEAKSAAGPQAKDLPIDPAARE